MKYSFSGNLTEAEISNKSQEIISLQRNNGYELTIHNIKRDEDGFVVVEMHFNESKTLQEQKKKTTLHD